MHRIVDAMNVIGSRPDGWWRDRPGAIARLLELLERRAAAGGERLTVVLERRPEELAAVERVEVAWAPGGGRDAADEEIVRRLPEWLAADPEVVVVTSDRELARRTRELGAGVEPAGAFRRALDEEVG